VCERYICIQSELYRRLAGLGRPVPERSRRFITERETTPITMAHAGPIPDPATPKFGSDRGLLLYLPRPSSHI